MAERLVARLGKAYLDTCTPDCKALSDSLPAPRSRRSFGALLKPASGPQRESETPRVDIYYINLAVRTDRRAFMEAQFSALGLFANRIEAVTPADLSGEERTRYCNPRRAHWLQPTELACSRSHLRAMQAIVRSGAPYAVILEDDVTLSKLLPGFLAQFDATPPPFDLVRLETDGRPLRLKPGSDGALGGVTFRLPASGTAGAGGYLISNSGARMTLASKRMLERPSDEVMFYPYDRLAKRLSARHCEPGLCIQNYLLGERQTHSTSLSDLSGERDLRPLAENRFYVQRLPGQIAGWFDRDIRVAALKLWYQTVGGTRKQSIEFKAG